MLICTSKIPKIIRQGDKLRLWQVAHSFRFRKLANKFLALFDAHLLIEFTLIWLLVEEIGRDEDESGFYHVDGG